MAHASNIKIPLQSLLAKLRTEGFDIGTSTILDLQRVIANVQEQNVEQPADLKYLLSPIICRNKEEQEKFYKIFDEYLACKADKEMVMEPEGINVTPGKKKNWIWWVFVTVMIAAAAAVIFKFKPQTQALVSLGIVELNNRKINLKGDTITLRVNYADSVQSKTYKTAWVVSGPYNFLQSLNDSNQFSTVIDSAGTYVAVAATFNSDGKLLKNDTSIIEVLCEIPPTLSVSGDAIDSVTGAFVSTITNTSHTGKGYTYHWFVNDVPVAGDSTMRTNLMKVNQPNIIRLIINWPGQKLHCSVDSLSDELNLQPPIQLFVSGDTKAPLTLSKNYNWSNIILSVIGIVFFPLLMYGFVRYRLRKRTAVPSKEEDKPLQEPVEKQYIDHYSNNIGGCQTVHC